MKIAPFLSFLNQLKVFHWQTSSYSQHKALGKAYTNLDNLFDTFVEAYYGKYGKIIDVELYTTVSDAIASDTSVLKTIGNRKRDLLQYLRSDVVRDSDGDLKNIVDEIEAEISLLQYQLQLV
jgi:DNA-binding ferritin-like protein